MPFSNEQKEYTFSIIFTLLKREHTHIDTHPSKVKWKALDCWVTEIWAAMVPALHTGADEASLREQEWNNPGSGSCEDGLPVPETLGDTFLLFLLTSLFSQF